MCGWRYEHIEAYHYEYQENISSRFSHNFEANASELVEIIEKIALLILVRFVDDNLVITKVYFCKFIKNNYGMSGQLKGLILFLRKGDWTSDVHVEQWKTKWTIYSKFN